MKEQSNEGASAELSRLRLDREGELRIREGIEAAEREERIIDHATARRIADQLHSGPDSALWLLVTTGALRLPQDDEEMDRSEDIFSELLACDRVFPELHLWLEAMAGYVLHREDDAGPLKGWRQLSAGPETEGKLVGTPRIYVISVDEELAGNHFGTWIDADQDVGELLAAIQTMLDQSAIPDAVSWDIFDHSGFGGVDVFGLIDDSDPEAGLEVISQVALGVAEHGAAFAAYVGWAGTGSETLAKFAESYTGFWPDITVYAEHLAEQYGWPETLDQVVPVGMRAYVGINYARLVADTERERQVVEADGGVYVFLDF